MQQAIAEAAAAIVWSLYGRKICSLVRNNAVNGAGFRDSLQV